MSCDLAYKHARSQTSLGLMRLLLNLSDRNFLFWGADSTGDVFSGYTFTLESGFPEKSIETVLYSIPLLDRFVGEMRPFVDGSTAPAPPAPAAAPAAAAAPTGEID